MNRYASHLPLLKNLKTLTDYQTVLEFGCGLYSTKFFVENCKQVWSVENMHEDWASEVRSKIKGSNVIYLKGLEAVESFRHSKANYDLIFVDGTNRQECVNVSFGRTPLIVVHDLGFKQIKTGWLRSVKKNDYKLFVTYYANPPTALFANDSELINKLDKKIYMEVVR